MVRNRVGKLEFTETKNQFSERGLSRGQNHRKSSL